MLQSKDCYECHKFKHKLSKYLEIYQLINDNLIHFNERKRMYFDKEKQKKVEMCLQYNLFRAKIVCLYFQQTNE